MMGRQIIRQPNGLFCVFSSITDTIVLADATAEDVIEEFAAEARRDAIARVTKALAAVKAGEPHRVYHQFAMTYDEAVELHRKHGGERHMVEGEP